MTYILEIIRILRIALLRADTIRANSYYSGEEGEVKIVVEKNERYVL